jgi:hypothetical protein
MKKISLEPEDEGLMRRLFALSRDPAHMSRLLVVQQRLRPGALLESKLSEALNLASSLEAGIPKQQNRGVTPQHVAVAPLSGGNLDRNISDARGEGLGCG